MTITFDSKYILVNNSSNNIDVYSMPKSGNLNKFEHKIHTVLDIQGKSMISSVCLKKKFVVGCKDGSVIEFDSETLKMTKCYKASTTVNAIEYLDSFLGDTFVIS